MKGEELRLMMQMHVTILVYYCSSVGKLYEL